jgi:DNA-directed RNA polymerase subunit N (RpoN/RPB10)
MQPLRCWTCGKSLHAASAAYHEAVRKGIPPAEALDRAGLQRYCCRRHPLADYAVHLKSESKELDAADTVPSDDE